MCMRTNVHTVAYKRVGVRDAMRSLRWLWPESPTAPAEPAELTTEKAFLKQPRSALPCRFFKQEHTLQPRWGLGAQRTPAETWTGGFYINVGIYGWAREREGEPLPQVTAGTYTDQVSIATLRWLSTLPFNMPRGSGVPPSLYADETFAKTETEQGKSSPE